MHEVRPAPGEVPALLAMAWLATYACVPETDHLPDIAVAIVGVFVIEVATRTPSGIVHLGTAFVLVVAGWYGATGRGSAQVGALFALWPLALTGIVFATFVHRRHRPLAVEWRFVVGAIGGVAALAVARTGAIQPTTGPAIVAVAVATPASLAAALAVSSRLT